MSLKRTAKPTVLHTIGHQTPAVQHAISTLGGTKASRSSGKRRKSRGSKAKTSSPRRKRSGGSKGSRKQLVAGSAAAKAWGKKMAKLRKK